MAVVKADAYGHGLLPSARAALRGGATWLGVAQLAEALELRQAGIDGAACSAGCTSPARTSPRRSRLGHRPRRSRPGGRSTQSPRRHGADGRHRPHPPQGRHRAGPQRRLGRRARRPGRARSPLCRPRACVSLVGVFSHFAYADAPQHPTVRAQQERFEGILAAGGAGRLRPEVRHLANSAATLTNPSAHYDLVRPGLAVYGLSPVPDLGSPQDFGLREAMRLTAAPGARSSPARRGRASPTATRTRPTAHTLLGLVPMGYADGIPRHADAASARRWWTAGTCASPAGSAWTSSSSTSARTRPVPPATRSSSSAGARRGSRPPRTGQSPSGTINYEIVTRVGARVPRVYSGEGAA